MKISEKILQIAKNQKITKRRIYTEIGITPQGFDDKLKKDYFLIGELQTIASILDVSVSYLIAEKEEKLNVVNGNNIVNNTNTHISIETYKVENEHLKKELQLKDEIIELLKSK